MKKLLIVIICLSVGFGESLWRGEKSGLFDDHRAKYAGDSITVIVQESVTSKQKTGNSIGNKNNVTMGPGTGYAGFMSTATSFPSESSFKASGEQSSEGELKTEVTVRVKEVLANGELMVNGTKITNLNGEKQIIEISGIVRPENIIEGNKVYSSSLADARITYTLDGEYKNASEPGFITKIFNMVF
ncbi:MAG: flagellar basal body L-ring protein FlgH [Candidatus Margulisbacteria bacterium]|nr:flagellar basal body L-ring protein FlgH [Candidatus Margulisiibacteriota bacterium]